MFGIWMWVRPVQPELDEDAFLVQTKLDAGALRFLPKECDSLSGKIARLNNSL